MRWAPETRQGRLSVALAGASLAGLVLLAASFGIGLVESVETFSDSWLPVAWGGAVLGAGAVLGVLMTLVVLNEVAQGL